MQDNERANFLGSSRHGYLSATNSLKLAARRIKAWKRANHRLVRRAYNRIFAFARGRIPGLPGRHREKPASPAVLCACHAADVVARIGPGWKLAVALRVEHLRWRSHRHTGVVAWTELLTPRTDTRRPNPILNLSRARTALGAGAFVPRRTGSTLYPKHVNVYPKLGVFLARMQVSA